MKTRTLFISLMVLLAGSVYILADRPEETSSSSEGSLRGVAGQPQAHKAYGNLTLSFESNMGRTDSQVNFISRGLGYILFLTPTEAVLTLRKRLSSKTQRQEEIEHVLAYHQQPATVVRMKLIGANPIPHMVGLDQLPGKNHYFIGNDPANWQTNIPTFAKVKYQNVYPGVDLVYYGNPRQLEYDFIVAPQANPEAIRLGFEGVEALYIDSKGNLILQAGGEELSQTKPLIYQAIDGVKYPILGQYVLYGKQQAGFQVSEYDVSKPLVIDPVLDYSTYLGGRENDRGFAIAVDVDGNTYITGFTESTDFPVENPLQSDTAGSMEIFVTKFNAAGDTLIYSTYLGGSGDDHGFGIAVDVDGNAYITGETFSFNFPTVNAFQPIGAVNGHAFVTKLSPTGSSLIYSTYLGGSGTDNGRSIAVDADGNAYVTGRTVSTDFPTVNPLQPTHGGGVTDAFVTKFNAAGDTLIYSTYLGGSTGPGFFGGHDSGQSLAVDTAGNIYITGDTGSEDFPTAQPLQANFGGGSTDVFLAKIQPMGSAFIYSTFIGGSEDERGYGIAVDIESNAYVTGLTRSRDFPTTEGAFQTAPGGLQDAFVMKLNSDGSTLIYSTRLGGSMRENGLVGDIAVDVLGNAYVTGHTESNDFPTLDPIQHERGGSNDAFVAKLNVLGNALIYSTYLGGSSSELGMSIAVDSAASAYVTGVTESSDFPTITPLQAINGEGGDVFVVKISGDALD